MEAKLIKHGHSYALLKDGKMVAFAHPDDFENDNTIGKLSLKNCQDIERGYDLDELAKHCSKQEYYDWGGEVFEQDYLDTRYTAYKQGFQKCLELMGDKKFSEDDLTMLFVYGHQIGMNTVLAIQSQHSPQPMEKPDSDKLRAEFIQSLQQTEWDCIIEMETVVIGQCNCPCHSSKATIMHFMACCHPERVESPKLDADGCLILKRK